MPLTKVTGKGITCSAVTEDKIGASAVTTNKINNDAVTSAKISNGAVTADDLASTLDLSSKTVTLPSNVVAAAKRPVQDNIALLGFKMAVNDGLTIFNLVDGVVDEFNDESGTDEAEGTNDVYCATSDYYHNVTLSPFCVSAGMAYNSVTEPDTSTAQCQPGAHTICMTTGTFTVPTSVTSMNFYAWGSGGGGGGGPCVASCVLGGGGGFTSGAIAVTPGQTVYHFVGNGGQRNQPPNGAYGTFGSIGGGSRPGAPGNGGGGGGLTLIGTSPGVNIGYAAPGNSTYPAPAVISIAGAGGGSSNQGTGGAGGGTTGQRGAGPASQSSYATCANGVHGGGGGHDSGGLAGSPGGSPGGYMQGGCASAQAGAGGAGWYGGGGAGNTGPQHGGGGGGSSYIGHPQITSGATENGAGPAGGGTASPYYVAGTNESGPTGRSDGEKGYVLYTASGCSSTLGASTTIVSTAFTSTTVATTARIVVFEENVDTPTLNTDIIASVSRDGTNFTNATLTDSGYVTGSSGQRILTGQADISGQPSGQSMRWKLALANNTVKIHGVALQWS
jgi:hypothetical protein